MKNELLTVEEASARIERGDVITVAGDEAVLAQLPKGNWVGGTSVYFVTEEGGAVVRDKVFCTTFEDVSDVSVRTIPTSELVTISDGYKPNGFTIILIPAFSDAHTKFAVEGQTYAGVFGQPLVGWISGVHLDELGTAKPKVFDGKTGEALEDGAAVMHVSVPAGNKIGVDIVNIFSQGHDNKTTFTFDSDGFSAKTAKVNGEVVSLANYLTDNEIDTRLPLIANYGGALINVSVQAIDLEKDEVSFYAPVMTGVEYQLAAPLANYPDAFAERLGAGGAKQYSCNCILNYLYGELEGQSTGKFTGPVTFGEIAYILLNQTLVKLQVQPA